MNLFTAATAKDVTFAVANEIVATVARGPTTLGLATGRTFDPIYCEIAKLSGTAFNPANIRGAQIDEYVGVSPTDPRSFAHTLGKLVPDVVASHDRILRIDGAAPSPEEEIERHASLVAARGGMDLLLLGLGRNGHIAFNEPGSTTGSDSCIVALADATRQDAADAFGGSPPIAGITLVIRQLRQARSIYLVATGAAKHDAFARLGDPKIPASHILDHPGLRIFADSSAVFGA